MGKIVSRPYIEMTLNLMAYFGVQHNWEGQVIKIAPQKYIGKPFIVEADWSAASYYYIMAAFAEANAAGGVHGRQITLESFDDGYEPDRSIEHVR